MAEDAILLNDPGDNVIPLGKEPPATPEVPASRPGRLHGLAIAGIAVSALSGIVATFLLVSIDWPGDSARYVVAVIAFSVLAFLASASIAILTAARDTYAAGRRSEPQDRD